MIVGCDIDGVLADFHGELRRRYEEWFGAKIQPDYSDWDWPRNATHFKSYDELWRWADCVPNFWDDIPPIRGAMGGIMRLLDEGHSIHLITSRAKHRRASTERWADNHLPWGLDKRPAVHMPTNGKKSSIDAQVYIDDDPKVIEELLAEGRRVIRFIQPWNEGAGGIPAKTWDDVTAIIAELEKDRDAFFPPNGLPAGEVVVDRERLIADLGGGVV